MSIGVVNQDPHDHGDALCKCRGAGRRDIGMTDGLDEVYGKLDALLADE